MKPMVPCITLAIVAASAQAQQPSETGSGGITVTASVRAWFADFNSTPVDAQVIVGPGGAPLIQTFTNTDTASSKVMPVLAVSATMDRFTLAASFIADTKFDNPNVPGGQLGRREYDISLAYAIVPSRLSAALIYKSGKLTDTATVAAENLLGLRGDVKIDGWLVGLSGNAPLGMDGRLGLYGNVAAGRGRAKSDFGPRENIDYLVSEVGLSWAIGPFGPTKGGALVVGYRTQTLSGKFTHVTVDPATSTVVATNRIDTQNTTRGPIVGLLVNF
jgi:hypothetical protein